MAIKIFRPDNVITNGPGAFSAVGAGTIPEAIDPGDAVVHDDDTTYASRGSGGGAPTLGLGIDDTFPEVIAAVNQLIVRVRCRHTGGGGSTTFQLGITLDSQQSLSTGKTIGATYADFEFDITNSKPGGGSWDEQDFRNTSLEMQYVAASGPIATRITSLWMFLDFVAGSSKVEFPRRTQSRRLALLSRPVPLLEVRAPFKFVDVDLFEKVPVVHQAGPEAAAQGWRHKNWQRRNFVVLRQTFDPMTLTTAITLIDPRFFWRSLWDVARSDKSVLSRRDGVAALDAGVDRTFTRSSAAWVDDPEDGRIVPVSINQEKMATSGFLVERSVTNEIQEMCFKNGIDNGEWTLEGEGVNSSALNDDTSDLFWDDGETPNSLQMIAGDPLGATELAIRQTSSSYAANSVITASVTHKDDSGDPISLLIQRAVDSFYYNASTPGWQSGEVFNDLTVRSAITRDFIKGIDVGGSATTITLSVVAQDTAAQENHIYDVQLEDCAYPTSRILTTDASATREADLLEYSNNSGARLWFPTRGTALFGVIPLWDSADLDSGERRTIINIEYDASNRDRLFFENNGGTRRIVFQRVVSSTTYTAFRNTTWTAGTGVVVGARWISDQGELDETNYTISVFEDGTKGTDATAAASATDNTDAQYGSEGDDVNAMDCYTFYKYVTPQCFTDEEIAAESARILAAA